VSQTTFPSLRNDAQVATDSGSIEMPAPLKARPAGYRSAV
jgi:hypothetical protein